jgi:hypothetical protein
MFAAALLMSACVTSETTLSVDPPEADDPAPQAEDDTAVDTPPADTGDTALPDPYIYEDETPPDALLDEAGVARALEEALSTFFTEMDPFLALEALDAAVAVGDGYCPYRYEEYEELYGYQYLYGGCSAAGGTSFEGYIYGDHIPGFWSSVYYYPDYGWWYGDMTMEGEAEAFTLTGYWNMYRWEILEPAQTYVYVNSTGDALWEGETYGDTWLGWGMSTAYTLSGGFDPQLGSWLQIDGGVSALPGETDSLWMDGVFIGSAGHGSTCPLEPSGTLSVRDAAGGWYDVDFQGPSYAGASSFAPECDGCGDIWYRGEPFGQACLDFSPLTTWIGSPW